MSAITRTPGSPFTAPNWHADVVQLLDENHLAAFSLDQRRRVSFASSLTRFLAGMRDVEVCTFHGRFISDLESFCSQLEDSLAGPTLERRIHGPGGVVSLLQSRQSFRGRTASKYRYYIWNDADILLNRDPDLFGRLVDAMTGVAAESEYCDDDVLLIHRAVFIGGPSIEMYADDSSGQFQSWYNDGHPDAFWQVVTDIERPSFMTYRIDSMA